MDQVLGGEGRALGSRYVLGEPIGQGSASQVFRATVRDSGRIVAVKILRPELSADPELIAQFVRERSILTSIHDTHVVQVIDLVVEGSSVGMVMELVEGEDLRHYLHRSGPLPAAQAARLIDQILQGMTAIHQAGIVHRDIKPENILVDESSGPTSLMITDFGIAILGLDSTGTATGTAVVGTPHYMAPEVIEGLGVSPATDIYSVGVIFYEMLSGRTPFADSPLPALLVRQETEAPRRIPGLPDDLWRLVGSLLAKDPASRPSAAAIQAALSRLEPSLADLAALPSPRSDGEEAGGVIPEDSASRLWAVSHQTTNIPTPRLADPNQPGPPGASFHGVPPSYGPGSAGYLSAPVGEASPAPFLGAAGSPYFPPTWEGYPPRTAEGHLPTSPVHLVHPIPEKEGSRRFPLPGHPVTEDEIKHNSGVLRRYNFGAKEFLLVDVLNRKLTLNWTTDATPVDFAELIMESLADDDAAAKVTLSLNGVMGDIDAELGATMIIAGSDSFDDKCEFLRFDSKRLTMALQVLPGSGHQSVRVFGVGARTLSLDVLFPLIVRTATREIVVHALQVGSGNFVTRLDGILRVSGQGAMLEKAE